MVEKSHTATGSDSGWWPSMYEPLRNVGRKIADFFAPEADASATENAYVINIELPGVEAANVDVSIHDHMLTLKGERNRSTRKRAKPISSPSAATARFSGRSVCRRMSTRIKYPRTSRTGC